MTKKRKIPAGFARRRHSVLPSSAYHNQPLPNSVAEIDRCYAIRFIPVPRYNRPSGNRHDWVCHTRARAYDRVLLDSGVWVWNAAEWLGPARRCDVKSQEDGMATGLPYLQAAQHRKLAMCPDDFLPTWAQSALRLGWGYRVALFNPETRYFYVQGEGRRSRVICTSVHVEVDGESVARFGAFRDTRTAVTMLNRIAGMLVRSRDGIAA